MSHFSYVACILVFFGVGCQQKSVAKGGGDVHSTEQEHRSTGKADAHRANQRDQNGTRDDQEQSPKVTRKDLDEYLERFKSHKGWTYGERTPGELVGTWVSTDGDGDRVIFGEGGTYREDLNGNLTSGLFAISEDDKVVAVSRFEGITIGSHFRLNGKKLIGPKGPNPNAEWERKKSP